MDLRFEAAAANEYAENTKNDVGFSVPKIYWNFTSEEVLTLDWVEGISIREKYKLELENINIKNCFRCYSTFFKTCSKGWFFSCRYASRKYFYK